MRLPTFYEQNLIPNWGIIILKRMGLTWDSLGTKDLCRQNSRHPEHIPNTSRRLQILQKQQFQTNQIFHPKRFSNLS